MTCSAGRGRHLGAQLGSIRPAASRPSRAAKAREPGAAKWVSDPTLPRYRLWTTIRVN